LSVQALAGLYWDANGSPFFMPFASTNSSHGYAPVHCGQGFFGFTAETEGEKMVRMEDPNIEPDWPEGNLEFTYDLLVSAIMARICARRGADIREDM